MIQEARSWIGWNGWSSSAVFPGRRGKIERNDVPTRPRRSSHGPRLAAVSKLWRGTVALLAIKSAASRCPPRLARASFASSIVARLRNRVFRIKRSVPSSLDTRDRASISFVPSFLRSRVFRAVVAIVNRETNYGTVVEALIWQPSFPSLSLSTYIYISLFQRGVLVTRMWMNWDDLL